MSAKTCASARFCFKSRRIWPSRSPAWFRFTVTACWRRRGCGPAWRWRMRWDLIRALPLHQLLSPAETLAREPSLRAEGLAGAALVWEVVVPSVERLALEMALDARAHGACLRTHTQVERLRWEKGPQRRMRATGVFWTDRLTGERGETAASLVILAAGAWLPSVDDWLAEHGAAAGREERLRRRPAPARRENALAFPREEEGSLLFVLPGRGRSWLGSLETPFAGDPDTVHASGAEVQSLVQAAREFLPDADWNDLALAQAAVLAPLPPAEFPLPAAPYQFVDYAARRPGAGGPAVRRRRQPDFLPQHRRGSGRPRRPQAGPLACPAPLPHGVDASAERAYSASGLRRICACGRQWNGLSPKKNAALCATSWSAAPCCSGTKIRAVPPFPSCWK